ncbi:MAG: hypothetical protein KKE83_07995 [Proteobacteria bacterium]|nr:hypothetical protein [Pseudomonadota bacterium]
MKLFAGEFFAWFVAKARGSKAPAFSIWSLQYLSLKNATWDEDTNIFPGISQESVDRLLDDITLSLKNEDPGKAFYEKQPSSLPGARCSNAKKTLLSGRHLC